MFCLNFYNWIKRVDATPFQYEFFIACIFVTHVNIINKFCSICMKKLCVM